MKTLIISSSPLIVKGNEYYAYAPYAKELEIWAKYSNTISFTCPIWIEDKGLLISKINFSIENIVEIKEFNLKSVKGIFNGLNFFLPNVYKIYKSIGLSDHIHLRSPGNISLLACIVQIFFPKKYKTAKYAGNWDFKSKQPLSYKIQKIILNSTLFTKNINVLVYGEWENSSKNIKPFFTATYREDEKKESTKRSLNDVIKFIFVGALVKGKRAQYAIKIIEKLNKLGNNVQLTIYGNGPEKMKLEKYCISNNLERNIIFKGNQSHEIVKKAYQESHFLILPSKSEGWPKAVAEAMFWGCLPVATSVSCVPNMLENENRGLLLNLELENDTGKIIATINNQNIYDDKVNQALTWSRKYTLDYFESEIKLLLKA